MKGGSMKYKIFPLLILCSCIANPAAPIKKLFTKKKERLETRREVRQPRTIERREVRTVREMSVERSLERERQMTKCLDISKIFVTIVASIIGIILAGSR